MNNQNPSHHLTIISDDDSNFSALLTKNSWLKRNGIDSATATATATSTSKVRIFSDPQLSFMASYEIIGDDIDHRWSMTMLVFDTNGDILRVERDVDPSRSNQLVSSTIRELSNSSSR